MAPTTRSRPMSDALVSSDPTPSLNNKLHGPVPENAANNWEKMATYLGLGTKLAVKKFLASDNFSPIFEKLYKQCIEPQQRSKGGQGPKLDVVQARLASGEAHGAQKYSGYEIDFTGWVTEDHYAFCLFRLSHRNKFNHDGIFRDKMMHDSDIEARMWMCMLRERKDRNPNLKANKHKRQRTLDSELANMFGDTPVAKDKAASSQPYSLPKPPMLPKVITPHTTATPAPVTSSPVTSSPVTSAPVTSAPVTSTPVTSTPGTSTPVTSAPVTSAPVTPSPVTLSPSLKRTLGKASSGSSSHQQDVSAVDASSSEVDEPDGYDTPEDESMFIPETENKVTSLERMKASMNRNNPWDITTDYGRYAVIHLVHSAFKDLVELRRLRDGYKVPDVADAARDMQESTKAWDQEVMAMMERKRLELKPSTQTEFQKASKFEKLLDNIKLQPTDYSRYCTVCGIDDPERPHIRGMKMNGVLEGWQVTGIGRMIEIWLARRYRGVILADGTGLGKTIELLGFILFTNNHFFRRYDQYVQSLSERQEAIERRDQQLDNRQYEVDNEPDVVVPEMPEPVIGQPKLIIVLPDLISQMYNEVKNFTSALEPRVYHGDKRKSITADMAKVSSLTQNHEIFDGKPERAKIVVITSRETLVARHGPKELRAWRMKHRRMTFEQAEALKYAIDPDWPGNLEGKFEYREIDEAHQAKNPQTIIHTILRWWGEDAWTIMATANMMPNRISDFDGYAKLLEKPGSGSDITKSGFNPYEVGNDHPAAAYRVTSWAITKFITGEHVDEEKAGMYLAKVLEEVAIRRTYQSKNPQKPNELVGKALPNLRNRQLISNFNDKEVMMYDHLAFDSERKLITILEDGKICWNRKYARRLILLSSWLGWYFIEAEVHASTMSKWKASPNLLYDWVVLLQKKMLIYNATEGGTQISVHNIPAIDDIAEQLAVICRGAPKIRDTLRIIAELVILKKRKLVIWCSLPASQLLLYACLKALRIDCGCYTAELSAGERAAIVNDFTSEPSKCMVFIGSYYVGSTGLNLQKLCNHSLQFDSPLNKGIEEQALGRVRRMYGFGDVENLQMYNRRSFQNRVSMNTLAKAIPVSVAQLTVGDIDESATGLETDDDIIDIGQYYLVDGELIQGPDARIPAGKRALNPTELVFHILHASRGDEIDLTEWDIEPMDTNTIDLPMR